MPWTADALIRAYRLTATPELAARALADGVERTERWLREPAYGGVVQWTWHRRYFDFLSTRWLGLPEQAVELRSVTLGGFAPEDGQLFLAHNGWSIRRRWPVVYTFGDIVATGVVADDSARRDSLAASFALETMGYDEMEQGRGWRRILMDAQGPPARGRLPDTRVVLTAGTPDVTGVDAPPPLYFGTAVTADHAVELAMLTRHEGDEFRLPSWDGRRYLLLARLADAPIEAILIGGIDQAAVFRRETLTEGANRYDVWRSQLPWDGAIAGGAMARVE